MIIKIWTITILSAVFLHAQQVCPIKMVPTEEDRKNAKILMIENGEKIIKFYEVQRCTKESCEAASIWIGVTDKGNRAVMNDCYGMRLEEPPNIEIKPSFHGKIVTYLPLNTYKSDAFRLKHNVK